MTLIRNSACGYEGVGTFDVCLAEVGAAPACLEVQATAQAAAGWAMRGKWPAGLQARGTHVLSIDSKLPVCTEDFSLAFRAC
jgi:hypothetical protein